MVVFKYLLITWTIVTIGGSNCAEIEHTDVLLSNPVVQELMVRLSALDAQAKVQQNRITELESRDHTQQKQISDLEDVVRYQQQEMEEMKVALTDTSKTNAHLKEEVTENTDEITQNEFGEHNKAKNSRIRRQQPEVDTVAFTAVLVHSRNDLGLNQNVVFDHVETNIGNAYNPHHGVFTAPIAGTYVFYVSVFSVWDTDTRCKIVVNGVQKVRVYAYGSPTHHDQGSQTLVVRLNQGDDVAIQNAQAHDNVFGNTDMWTTFSGFLLRSDAEVTNIVG